MKKIARRKEWGRKKSLRMLSVMLCFCLLITACPYMPGTVVVHAAGGQEIGRDAVIQALLERIAALPDSEEYLAKEPDTEEEEAYAEWMEGLYQYAGEALDIQEAYEALTGEQQASVSEEALAKLAAWVEIAKETVMLSVEVLADHSHPVCGASCSHGSTHGSLSWTSFNSTGGTLGSGNYYLTGDVSLQTSLTIPSGTEVNLCLNGYTLSSSFIEVNGALTVCDCSNDGKGVLNSGGDIYKHGAAIMEQGGVLNLYGGKLTGNSSVSVIYVGDGSTANLFGGMVEDEYSYPINNHGTVIISGNTVVRGNGSSSSSYAVMNNSDDAVLTVKDNASLSSKGHGVCGYGTVNIEGGTIASTRSDGYGIDNRSVLNITGGTITGNKYGVYMGRSASTLNLSGSPEISGSTADMRLYTSKNVTLGNVKVDATGYNGSTLSVEECDTTSREGAYAIKVSEGKKDKFTLINEGDVMYQYKDGGLMLHTHSYTYTADGAVITENCSCGHKETATLCQKQDANLTYTGSAIKPVTVSYSNNWAGDKPADSAITYSNNINAGSTAIASLKISNATASLKFTIAPKSLTASMIALASNSYSYTGSAIKPTVTVTDGGKIVAGSNYTVSYLNNTSVGTATVTITGEGNYTGTINKNFAITAADISSATVTLSSTTLTYNGSAQTKGVSSVKVGSTWLTEGTDYTVEGNTGTDAGTHTITITGINGYAGSTKTVTFRIEPKSLTGGTVTVASGPHYYTGTAIEPDLAVKDGNKPLEKGKDYTVSYENNVNVGTDIATVKITGTGNYTGTLSGTFTIAYRPLPSGKSLADYVTISPEPINGWYGSDITLTPINGCRLGETLSGIGSNPVTISQETGTGGDKKTVYIKDSTGNIYQTEFSYKLDKTPPAVDLTGMTVENGTKNLWDWIIGKKSMMIKIPVAGITETLSGVAEVSYTAESDNGTTQTGTIHAQDGYYQIALHAEFSGTIKLTVKDKAGHTTQASLTAASGKVIAEDYVPVVTFTLPDTSNADGWYHTGIEIKVTVTDDKDSNSGTILSGGIAKIQWKDGANGTVQTVAGLPGNSPVCEKNFTISVNTDGTHTYYVNAFDNAGNESGWQKVTVKVDTGKPEFNGTLTAKNPTEEGADIVFTPSEGGKVYWIVSDTGTALSAQEVKEQSGQKGGVQDIAGGTENSFTITGLSAGEEHTVYVVLEDAAGNLSEIKTESFLTLQKAPEITLEQLIIDYTKETIKLPDNFRDVVEVYTDPQDPENSKITSNADGLPVTPGSAVYIRYPKKTESGMTVPASDKTEIQIPGRPDKPAAKQAAVTDSTVTVKNPAAGEEYALVKKGQTPDWSKANTTGQFTGLDAKTEYDLYVRKKATENSFVSEPAKTETRTSVAIKKPAITGDGAGKDGNTAPKPDASNADGTVTFTGAYSEEYTPVIKADSQENTPEMTWDKDSGKGRWEYTYQIPDNASEVEITVEFRKRTLTGITAEPGSLAIYADDAANVSMEALNDYVKANCSVKAAYDNQTSGTVQAAYATTDSFEPKGGVYSYTISDGGKTVNATLTVNTVSAAATAPDKCLRNQKAGGYTEAEVAAWLPGQATVTYTGAGYTARTESRAVTWDTGSIGTDFGAATGEKTISGTVDLPAWATGQNTVSMVIEFVDKNILKDDQIQLTMPGFSYGTQTPPEPQGSVTVTDTNPVYTYLYSMDNGTTWVTADKLPKSGSGYIIPGEYRVKMTYKGDSYIGEKAATFSVAKKELTVLPGTLEAEDKTYDKTMNASLKEGGQPALSGVVTGDDVTLGGSLNAVFSEAGPKKDIPVTVSGYGLEGRDAGYYELKNTTLTLYADINQEGGGNVDPATKEEKPNIQIDYRKETLTGFTPGEKYKITVNKNTVTITAAADGILKLEEEWLGTTVSIVKCGNGKDKLDSDALSLTVPARSAQAPSPQAVDESRPGAADGKLTGLEADKNYQISTDNGNTWKDVAADKNGGITNLAPGSYIVRVSGTDSAFAGMPSVKVTIVAGQGTKPETEHTFPEQWTVEKEATEKEPGRRYKICETCGIKIYQTIEPLEAPVDPYAGKIEKEVDVLPGAPDTVLNNSREELAKSILTPEEIAQVENGVDAKIWLEVAPDVDIAEEEKAQVQKAAEESVGAGAEVTYFDASLFKQVGNGEKTIIHEPGRPVSVTIVIPEDIRNKDVLMVRNYRIIRLHEGKTDIIEGTYKEDSAEFTFETDKFSVYAICYKDSPKQAGPGIPTPTPGGTTEPGTPTPTPGGTTKPEKPTPAPEETAEPEIPSKEEQTKNELTLNAKMKVSQSGKKIKVSWGKISDADGYDVYVQYCGKKFTKKSITAIKNGKTTKVTVKKVNGKPLNRKKNYKIYVLAYKLVGGKKITLGKTITAHIVGKMNTKYTNVKAVKVKKSSYHLKKGKTAQIKAKTVLVSPGKKQLTNAHAKQFRYATTNKKVATVSKKGKIKAVGKGTCTIYVYARNGYAKKVKVTVK